MVEISVIIPVYNCEEYLNESMDGILNQTFTDIEVICVDDGSSDNSLSKLKEFEDKDNRVKVFHQENQGGGNARNFAMTKASGKYLYFMDADDMIYTEALENCYRLCEDNDLDFMLFKAKNYTEETGKYSESAYFTMDSIYDFVGDDVFSPDDLGELIFEFSATPWGKLFNRNFVEKSGAKFAEKISFHDNKFFWEMLFNSKRVMFLNETYYVRRIHSKSLIGSKNRGYFNIFIAYDQIFDIFRKYNHFDEFKQKLYNWKISIIYFRFAAIHESYKQEFLERFKSELIKMENEEGKDSFQELLDSKCKEIYTQAMASKTAREFSLSMEVYDLKENISQLKDKNRKLKKDYDKSKSVNDELMNSTSWKITKPLRGIRNIKR